jgi:hypothetical protein
MAFQSLSPDLSRDVPVEEMRELLFVRDLRMTRPALQKAEERSGVILSETGSDHLHVITEEVSRVAELCITQNMGTMGTAKYVPGTRDVQRETEK